MKDGWTVSWRAKWENPVFRNLREAAIWAWMCDTAVWKRTKIRFNGNIVNLERGQLATSVRFISKGFLIGERATRTFLENLENDFMIDTLPTHWGTIITICKYDEYQMNENTDDTPTNTRPTHGRHTADTNKNKDNKINKYNKYTAVNKPDDVTPQTWDDFNKLRKSKKAPITQTALDGIRKEAVKAKWSMESALRKCCERGWKGFEADWVEKEVKPMTAKEYAMKGIPGGGR